MQAAARAGSMDLGGAAWPEGRQGQGSAAHVRAAKCQMHHVVLCGALLNALQRPLAGGDHKHLGIQHGWHGTGVQVRRSSSLTGGSLGSGGVPGAGAGLHSQQQQLLAQQLLAQQVCAKIVHSV